MDDGSFLTDNYEPCCVCGKLTNRVDYCYEARICSKECENVINQEISMYEKKKEN